MAHRGDSANIPENTMKAFQDAYELGVDCIETDVRLTKDNEFVFFHDMSTARTTNGTKKVHEYTLAELKALDAGYKFKDPTTKEFSFRGKGLQIWTIDEIVPKFPNVRFNMDIKNSKKNKPNASKLLADKLKALGVEKRVQVGSFHQDQIDAFRKFSECPTSAGPKETLRFWRTFRKWRKSHKYVLALTESEMFAPKETQETVFGESLEYGSLTIPEKALFLRIITPDFIKFAHLMEIAIHVWTINDAPDIRRLLEWGVDGIFTDRPKVMLNVLKTMNFTEGGV